MTTLSKPLRNQLEKAVKQARVAAEQGARQALEALAVHNHEPWGSMDAGQRQLRRRLRAHGRQLGDQRDPQSGRQRLECLSEEVAYEFWHRMLFARFLAENELLIETRYNVPITFSECEELAREQGEDPWEFAAGLAQTMLPQIFRDDSPAFELTLPPEHQVRLVRLLEALPAEVFYASDSLGWVYQFWQTARKEKINAAGNKIGARELPVVTQLFTEPYMVSFLLDNSLGAWWASRRLSKADLREANSEEQLRRKAAIPGISLEYLRFVQQKDGSWKPAAGAMDDWPEKLADLKTLDPCCGSGHFLVAAVQMLVPMRLEQDGLSPDEAVDAVLRENIYGLEIDQRCVELAAFALALVAWCYPGTRGYRALPPLNIACTGISISAKKSDWLELAEGSANLAMSLEALYDQFKYAPSLGSLIDPSLSARDSQLFDPDWGEISASIGKALSVEEKHEKVEVGVAAQGLVSAAEILAIKPHFCFTNFPFLGLEKQNDFLRSYLKKNYPYGYRELAVALLQRYLSSKSTNCIIAAVMPGEWTFLRPHRHFRKHFLENHTLRFIAKLGWSSFQTPIRAQPVLVFSSPGTSDTKCAISILDAAEDSIIEKMRLLHEGLIVSTEKSALLASEDARIQPPAEGSNKTLADYFSARTGMSAGDSNRFERYHFELQTLGSDWKYQQTSVSGTRHYSGRTKVVFWQQGKGEMSELAENVKHLNHAAQNWRRGMPNWDKQGVVISLMGSLPVTAYSGDPYDINCCAIVSDDQNNLNALWAYAFSGELSANIRKYDSSLKIGSPKTILAAPFDARHWSDIAENMFPSGFPDAYSNEPIQWIFHGHPCGSVIWEESKKCTSNGSLSVDDRVLQVSVARLLGYRWPAELKQNLELAEEQREWARRCQGLLPFADDDGIVCFPPIRGEAAAADRLRDLLKAAYGDAWSASTERELVATSAGNSKPATSLDQWLRERFFEQHCKLFQNRPFIWHIWDGRKDGFHALVNYHKLAGPNGEGRRTLEALTYSYLGEWIDRQRSDQQHEVEGSDARLAAALSLQSELGKILKGEPPYDLFIRWKPLHEQPLGWNPDINDGVRLNIRPFILAQDLGRKNAGILQSVVDKTWTNAKKPGVKDRGKEVESIRPRDEFPWFWGCDPEKLSEHRADFGAPLPKAVPAGRKFDGQRWNNLHYSRAAREAARTAYKDKD